MNKLSASNVPEELASPAPTGEQPALNSPAEIPALPGGGRWKLVNGQWEPNKLPDEASTGEQPKLEG